MLTGDNERSERALAVEGGISNVHTDMRPEHKVRVVDELVGLRPTARIGDGANVAPAVASATVVIAMGAMGTDVSIEAPDVALMGDDLRHLLQVLNHARRIMIQNIALSLAIIVTLMPLALLGVLGLPAVVLVHEVAEIAVIGNGVRAGRSRRLVELPDATAEPVRGTGHRVA